MSDDAIDIRERFADYDELLETVKDAVRAQTRISMPVQVSEDSEDGHTVRLQPLVKATIRKVDGSEDLVEMPVLPDVPIHHAAGGGITQTHAHKKGDEGIALISHALFDFWFQQGGVQSPGDTRPQSMSDAFYVPGIRSTPRKLQGVSKDSTQTRTDDKKTVHDVSHSAVTAVREDAAHQVNGMAVQSQKGGASHVVDAMTIQNVAGKILLNC